MVAVKIALRSTVKNAVGPWPQLLHRNQALSAGHHAAVCWSLPGNECDRAIKAGSLLGSGGLSREIDHLS